MKKGSKAGLPLGDEYPAQLGRLDGRGILKTTPPAEVVVAAGDFVEAHEAVQVVKGRLDDRRVKLEVAMVKNGVDAVVVTIGAFKYNVVRKVGNTKLKVEVVA